MLNRGGGDSSDRINIRVACGYYNNKGRKRGNFKVLAAAWC